MARRSSRPPVLDRFRLRSLWKRLWSNYWFVPGTMTVFAGLLSVAVAEVDERYIEAGTPFAGLLYGASAEGARAVLSTIAGSMITVAGVSFSVVLVALSQSASMFGPRLLPTFMRDRGNQVALGTFVATFVYCITLLMRVRAAHEGGEQFVPRLGVFLGLLLALGSVAVLIYFLHHASTSIQAGHILRVAGRQLDAAIEATFPAQDDEGHVESSGDPGTALARPRSPVPARRAGYVEAIDLEALVAWATRQGRDLQLIVRPGDHVTSGRAVAEVGPVSEIDEETIDALAGEVVISRDRGGPRDVLYRVEQIVDVAVRALSPGVNDPLTAVHAVHRLTESLQTLLARGSVRRFHHDESGRLRLVERDLSRGEVVDRAFTLIRHYGAGDPFVAIALLESLGKLRGQAREGSLRSALEGQARDVRNAAVGALRVESDRDRVERTFRELMES